MLLLSLLGTVNTNGTGSLFQKRLRFKLFNQDDRSQTVDVFMSNPSRPVQRQLDFPVPAVSVP